MLVSLERSGGGVAQLIADDDDVAVAAITVAELSVGVELATGRAAMRRRRRIGGLLEVVSVDPYDLSVCRTHAKLLAWVRRKGTPRGAHDLIIAATALARSREVVTVDAAGFKDLPGVLIRSP